MVEFKLFNIPIRVEISFWLTLGLLGFLMNERMDNALMLTALFVLAGFFSVLIHEMGHAMMIRKYGLPTEVVLSSFGGYATYPVGYLSRRQDFFVTFAGPALQLIAGLIVFFIIRNVQLPDNLFAYFVFEFFWISVIWAILNCLPVLPLDGGRMLAAAMGPRREKAVYLISLTTAILVAIYAITNGYIFGAVFMALFAYQNFQNLQQCR